jgi:pilus assembly protein Flp/PilA
LAIPLKPAAGRRPPVSGIPLKGAAFRPEGGDSGANCQGAAPIRPIFIQMPCKATQVCEQAINPLSDHRKNSLLAGPLTTWRDLSANTPAANRSWHMQLLLNFLRDTKGATSIEYAMIGAVVSIVIIGGTTVMGTKMNANFSTMADAFN